MTTIRDVAAAAGVSITTVSHVLSGQGRIPQHTRARVLQVASDLGYRANVHAQQLVTRRSRTLAVQIANSVDATAGAVLVPNSEYFLQVLNGAAEAAAQRSYATILVPPDAGLDGLAAFGVDGVVLVDPRGDEPFFTGRWQRRPLVTIGRPISPAREVPAVVDNDLVGAGTQMVEHLWQQGYRRPALITTDTARSYTHDIATGYARTVRDRGAQPVIVEIGEPSTPEGAADALSGLLDRGDPPDAVVTSSEILALSVLHEAASRGIDVPGELGICSGVDSCSLRLTSPQITGMSVNPRQVGHAAATALMSLVENGIAQAKTIEVPARLHPRGSTARS
ncbi:LacI family DNA-binding transcriptional regulator [Kibdelosporangium phytohabitans]|uniref:LacI family transcriptional regulator n=1 Tax=Kibdelosporangium phytohabitans TaxID=860235 RepID=A0A0N9HWV7_9PSEU|nr:LacI family DNA-binding transcriptional regulator [Kibdelosporangium phytohabitans]ALG11914.1 LacI family transcriptional regulator [Kibdelosporangium phytohabitans]MBE1463365.1 DNA-binding LacI/PurR family transcriptional regulator [Kibdelosporangium phytohabitans]